MGLNGASIAASGAIGDGIGKSAGFGVNNAGNPKFDAITDCAWPNNGAICTAPPFCAMYIL